MPINILDEQFLDRCNKINNPEKYQAFLADVRKVAKGYDPVSVIQDFMGSSSTWLEQAKALIYLAVQDTNVAVSKTTLNSILSSNSNFETCQRAAGLYLVTQRADDDAYLRELLLAPDPFTSPKASPAHGIILQLMAFSGNTSFIDLINEVLTKNYHFCSQELAVTALNTLGATVDEEEIPYTRSLSILYSDPGIFINSDDKYIGYSNCHSCRFFPCKINHYYAGGIQSCKLRNQIDPETAGEIIDNRDWGPHLVVEKLENNQQHKKTWKQARQFMAKKSYNQAIPCLCSALLLQQQSSAESKSSITPLAWIYLSHCFSVLEEKELAFIAMREALPYKKLIPKSKVAERRILQAFDDNPASILSKITDMKPERYPQLNYEERNQWVKAFDSYVYENISKAGDQWFGIGECCQKLGEFHLAELFMSRGAMISDVFLAKKILKAADEVQELSKSQDIGLSLERRKQERISVPVKIEYGFRLDTYEFEEISEAAKQATQDCHITGDYFEAVDQCGDFELAIEIMKAAVNEKRFDNGKAFCLYVAATLLIKLKEYEKAKKYLEWAIELNPEDDDIHKLYTYLTKLTPFRKFLLKKGYRPNDFKNRLKESFKPLKDLLMQLRKRPKKTRTGQGKLLKTFTVYKKRSYQNYDDDAFSSWFLENDDVVEVVEIGFSWQAFFFTSIWAFVRKMYGLGTVVMLIFIAAMMTNLALLILLSLIFGIKANKWKANHLIKRGFVKVQEAIIGVSKEDAIIPCLKLELQTKQKEAFHSMKLKDRKQCLFCKYEDKKKKFEPYSKNTYPGPIYDYELSYRASAKWCNYHKRYIGFSDSHALKLQADGSVKVNEWCKGFVVHDWCKDLDYFKSL